MMTCNYRRMCYAAVMLLLATAACTRWTPRVDPYGLPDHGYAYRPPEAIDDGWRTASLADTGIDPHIIDGMMRDFLSGNDRNIHSILIVRDGRLAFEEYFYGYDRNKPHYLASVTKSITSILVGIALQQHPPADVTTMADRFFPAYSDTKWIAQRYPVTLEHVLTMSAGLAWEADQYSRRDPRHTTHRMYNSADPIRFVLDRDLADTPGAEFYYNSGLTILLGDVVKQLSGLSIDDFAATYLFSPLGIADYQWDQFGDGTIQTDGGLSLRPRDMAKIGQLILDGGTWQGKSIVSKDWIAASTKKQIDARGTGYGYQWWIAEINNFARPIGVCMASGHGGQKIFIIPDYELVVVFTSKVFNRKGHAGPEGLLISYILPAVDSSLTHNPIVQLPPDRLDKFVGRYRSEALDYEFPLIRQGNHLTLKERFWSNVAIEPVSATRFIGDSQWVGKFTIEFFMNRDGDIDHCLAYFGLGGYKFDKIK